jgi:hypothetical protein
VTGTTAPDAVEPLMAAAVAAIKSERVGDMAISRGRLVNAPPQVMTPDPVDKIARLELPASRARA